MSLASRLAQPIGHQEFLELFTKCRPPTGWGRKIAVALSGGADSACLLFLLSRCVSHEPSRFNNMSLQSLTINHDLQEASTTMTNHCEKLAADLHVSHLTAKIPWGSGPYPPRPDGHNYESVARDARYHALFQALDQSATSVIAFAHHADDQVETALMRLCKGSTMLGASGMKPCRRWGMGSSKPESLTFTGHPGLSTWLVRPLLSVSKDRILATCDANKLEYVNDPSNFQPLVTVRNAIRYMLANQETGAHDISASTISPDSVESLNTIKAAASWLSSKAPGTPGREGLRLAAATLNKQVADIEKEVDALIQKSRLPSPVGTFLFSKQDFVDIQDHMVRTAFILRLLRYVSPHPWGSPQAEANRQHVALQRIVDNVCSTTNTPATFSAGGGVLWTSVQVSAETGRIIKTPQKSEGVAAGHSLAWIASRLPNYRSHPPAAMDVTEKVLGALGNSSRAVVLYDNRYSVEFKTRLLPEDILWSIKDVRDPGKLILDLAPQCSTPIVRWVHKDGELQIAPLFEDTGSPDHSYQLSSKLSRRVRPAVGGWVAMQWIRPIQSL